MDSLLFTPITLRGVTFRNRIVLSPMLTYSATSGYAGDWHYTHYAKFATGGVGLVMLESTKADPRGCTTPRDLGLWDDKFIPGLKRIADTVRRYGATPGIQLGHSGRKARCTVPWDGRMQMESHPGVDHGEEWEIVGPSAIAHTDQHFVPRELTIADIEGLVERYGKAAERADKCGFDVLELHGANGYLLHQFLSPAANARTDAYGGSSENRMRLPLEIADRVRQSWPEDKPLFYRLSAIDEAGWAIDDSAAFARALIAHGVDVIDCSSGGMTGRSVVDLENPPGYGYQVGYAAQIREQTGAKTMAVGHIIHADQAEKILQSDQADLVAIGRELLHNPNWALDAASKLGIEDAFSMVPPPYSYWLEKRAGSGFGGRPSTWQAGIEND